MTIQSLSTALTPQQILQLLQKTQVGNADAEAAGAAAEKAAVTGQDVPGAADASAEAASGGAAPAPQETLDPKTILALLKIQESQARAQVNAQFFSGDDGSDSQNLFGLGDPNTDNRTNCIYICSPCRGLLRAGKECSGFEFVLSRDIPIRPARRRMVKRRAIVHLIQWDPLSRRSPRYNVMQKRNIEWTHAVGTSR